MNPTWLPDEAQLAPSLLLSLAVRPLAGAGQTLPIPKAFAAGPLLLLDTERRRLRQITLGGSDIPKVRELKGHAVTITFLTIQGERRLEMHPRPFQLTLIGRHQTKQMQCPRSTMRVADSSRDVQRFLTHGG